MVFQPVFIYFILSHDKLYRVFFLLTSTCDLPQCKANVCSRNKQTKSWCAPCSLTVYIIKLNVTVWFFFFLCWATLARSKKAVVHPCPSTRVRAQRCPYPLCVNINLLRLWNDLCPICGPFEKLWVDMQLRSLVRWLQIRCIRSI